MILKFVPNRELLEETDNRNPWYKQLVNKANRSIQEGDLLFTVLGYGLDDDFLFSGEPEEIGQIL